MINSQINSILKSSSGNLITKSLLNKNISNNLIKQITKPYFKTNQNKTLLNTKSFCEKSQLNNNNNNTENLEQQSSTSNKKNEEFISFGFKTVKKEDRQDMVNSVFANVAKR